MEQFLKDGYKKKNIQGDIIGLVDANGNLVVEYAYDVWGKVMATTGSLAGTLGAANPFRYRGYYFDTETGLYYLQSLYYDAEIGRFINADDPDSMLLQPENVLSTNLFAYCNNNPVMYEDPSGYIKFSNTKNYYTLALNEWETNLLLDSISLGITAVSAVTAILAAIPTVGVSFAVAGAVFAVGNLVLAVLRYIDRCGGNKGLNFNLARKWYLINYVGYNKKEPSGFKSLSQIWSAVKSYVNKILAKVKFSVFEKLAKNKSKATICRLSRVIVDYKKGKKIVISKY